MARMIPPIIGAETSSPGERELFERFRTEQGTDGWMILHSLDVPRHRRQLMGELVRAWVDEIPEPELESHYAKAVSDLDEHDLSMLAAWHASLEVGQPIANREFLVNVFPSLGENRREALKIAAGFRGEEAFDSGVAEDQALDTVLPFLSRERSMELASECVDLYLWDRLGCDN